VVAETAFAVMLLAGTIPNNAPANTVIAAVNRSTTGPIDATVAEGT
jgi:hypothetical protein